MSRVWFITGSSRGLGRAIVQKVLESGERVIATARKGEEDLNDIVKRYGSDKVRAFSLDVADSNQIIQVTGQALEAFGRIDVVVNNAGYAERTPIETMTPESWRDQMEANFFGVVNVTRAFIPVLRKQRSGYILQVSSVGARVSVPGLAGYQSAKWAVSGFSMVLAQELKPLGIRVTALEPGAVMTDWAGSSMKHGIMTSDYEDTCNIFVEVAKQLSGMRSTPEKVADAIFHVSKLDDPPVRLMLGLDTVGLGKGVAEELAASDEKWKDITELRV